MSHVSECKTVYRNINDVEAAAKRLGGELIRGKTSIQWYNRFVDDSTQWKAMFSPEEAEKIAKMSKAQRVKIINQKMSGCSHAIKFKGINYEVGAWQRPDGTYRLRWDGFDGTLNRKMGGYNGGHFAQAYGIESAKRAALKKGWKTQEKPRADGQIELEVLVR